MENTRNEKTTQRKTVHMAKEKTAKPTSIPTDTTPIIGIYTVERLAVELGISERTMRQACNHGKLKAKKVAGRWIVKHPDLIDWIDNYPQSKGN